MGAEVSVLCTIAFLFTLPGSALLVLTGTWDKWQGLQRWIVVVMTSIAVYPVLFYALSSWAPAVDLGRSALLLLLTLCAVVSVAGLRKRWRDLFRFSALEWVALLLFALALLSRYALALRYPFPAWSDSLHHVLLTELTAQQGALPRTLAPYFPVPLTMYHLGLYALTGAVQTVAAVPAHTALVWTAQTLNALCIAGVYLLLDRFVSRPAALVGAATAGLFSVHPALYFSWGRFTQLASQTLMLAAWTVSVDAFSAATVPLAAASGVDTAPLPGLSSIPTDVWGKLRQRWGRMRAAHFPVGLLLLAALLSSAVFLLHFRVAVFYAILLLLGIGALLWIRPAARQRRMTLAAVAVLGILALVLVLPVLLSALESYLQMRSAGSQVVDPVRAAAVRRNYYAFPLSSYPYLVAPYWLQIVTGVALIVGVLRRNRIVLLAAVWWLLLFAIGNAYLLEIPTVSLTNLGAVLIMAYLPIALIIGAAAHEMCLSVPHSWSRATTAAVLAITLIGAVPATWQRMQTFEAYRYFVTDADLEAMAWIRSHVPADARFVVNSYFWLPKAPHGTDAGYWLPYLTGHETNAGAMLTQSTRSGYRDQVVLWSLAAERLESDPAAAADLRALGFDYIYIGAKGDFSGAGLDAELLVQAGVAEILYDVGPVKILRIAADQ